LDSKDQNVVDEVIRMISNQVGIGKEWNDHNYKATIGLERI
jgi:hypothetical protein